jgi:hypothetical protein
MRTALALLLLLVGPVAAGAQEKVGWVAALEGRAEVFHPGGTAWTSLAAGDDILRGDQLRTAAESRLKLLFRDDSVLTLAASSQLTVNEQTAGEAPTSFFSVLVGTVRALCTERYAQQGARFEMETPTAIAGVRGTGFVVTFDPAPEETRVVGLFDTTAVRSQLDPEGRREVRVGPGEMTTVGRGAYPRLPTAVPEDVLRGLVGATEVGGGAAAPATQSPSPLRASKQAATDPRLPKGQEGRSVTHERDPIDQPLEVLKGPLGRGGKRGPPPPPIP